MKNINEEKNHSPWPAHLIGTALQNKQIFDE
jgi:hypothetical protein